MDAIQAPPVRQKDSAWAVQCRVLLALMLRETKTLYGHTKLGFLWSFIEPCLVLIPIWAIFTITGKQRQLPFGMTVLVFIVSGEGVWIIFQSTVNKMLNSIKGNMSLLSYPQVTPLDVIVARAVLNIFAKTVTFILVLFGLQIVGQGSSIVSLGSLLGAIVLIWLLSLGVGVVAVALIVFKPFLENFVISVMRFLFFLSGIFFSIDMVPFEIKPIILLNPIFHIVELARTSFNPAYMRTDISWVYPLAFAVISLLLGLISERRVRPLIERL